MLNHLMHGLCAVGTMVFGAGVAHAQNYPEKPIRVFTTGAGGASATSPGA